MKTLLTLMMLGVIGILWFDNHSKRAALDQAEEQIESQLNMSEQVQALTVERDQLRLQIARMTNAPSSWYQERVNQKTTALDQPAQNTVKYNR